MIGTKSINPKVTIPPLENGDKLTRTEFERRYHAMPDHKKAELIEGNEQHIKLQPNTDGIIKSQIFPRLYLNKAALLAGDLAQVFATLQIGFATPEHQSFVN